MSVIDKFLNCFPSIVFEIIECKKQPSLSMETVSSAEREIQRMLIEAQRNLSKIKKLHKKGRISSEELMDHEYAVFELEQELEKFREENEQDLDLDNLEDLINE